MRRPLVLLLVGLTATLTNATRVGALGCYPPPVDAPVARPFDAPVCDYCPGHRGLDFATRPGQPVVAVAAGVASFVGLVARVRYVVIAQDDGRRATYGQLATSSVTQGSRVAAGARVGTATDLSLIHI